MTAGLLAYRLCDRDYDCDRCPLDAALRGIEREARVGCPTLEEAVRGAWCFPRDRRYSASHAWVMPVGPSSFRCGIDVFAARLLGHASGVILPLVNGRLRRGRFVCWLRDESAVIPLRTPIGGTVLCVNHELQLRPGLLFAEPYDAGWLFDARPQAEARELPGLADAEEQSRRTAEQLERLEEEVRGQLAAAPTVGPTLADGGERLADLRRILGAERYRRLVLSFLE